MNDTKPFPRENYWRQVAAGSFGRAPLGAFWQGVIDGLSAPKHICQRPESRYTHFNSLECAWLGVGDALAHALNEYEREVIPGGQTSQKAIECKDDKPFVFHAKRAANF